MRYIESGEVPDFSDIFMPSLTGALTDPVTQAAFNDLVSSSLKSPQVRKAARPIIIEGALWLGATAVVAGILIRAIK